MKGRAQPIVRLSDGKWYPTILAAAVDNERDPMVIIHAARKGRRFKRVEPSPASIEAKRKRWAEHRREYNARYYREHRRGGEQ